MDDIATQVHNLPSSTGVYLFRDERGAVLYVGKATSLKDRVSSYFTSTHDPKTHALVSKVSTVEHILTSTEVEALLLEISLIKRHRPPYNVMFRDDKGYPYIKITREPYPRITKTRKRHDDGAAYFGPYPNASAVKRTIETLCELFGLRTCTRRLEKLSSPCLRYHIGRCAAPCAGYISREEYVRNVREACELLEGKRERTIALLTEKMKHAARLRQFERAARLRDSITTLSSLEEARRLTQLSDEFDLIAVHVEYGMAAVELFMVRGGALAAREQQVVRAPLADPSAVLSAFIRHRYSSMPPPSQILVSHEVEDGAAIQSWLGHGVVLSMPTRGVKRRLMELALTNAEHNLRYHLASGHPQDALEELRSALGLSVLPLHIEGVDIAHTAGRLVSASVVVFRDGAPSRKEYRHYTIGTAGGDDPAAIYEVVSRRAARWQAVPDLLLVDGGMPQVSAAHRALQDRGLSVPVVGIAKRHEHLFLHGRAEPLVLDSHSGALHLLMHIRDEAHRFARRHHFRMRQREHGSHIERLDGVGKVRARALLERFGSYEGLRRASLEEIAAVRGIGKRTAEKIYEQLHPDVYKS